MTFPLYVKWDTLPVHFRWQKMKLLKQAGGVLAMAGNACIVCLMRHDRWLFIPFFLVAFGIVCLCIS